MMDLEIRGIVPRGYFEDAEQAMNGKKVRRENIIHDLTTRLASRPEFSSNLADKLMSKAMESVKQRAEMVESGSSPTGKETISQVISCTLPCGLGKCCQMLPCLKMKCEAQSFSSFLWAENVGNSECEMLLFLKIEFLCYFHVFEVKTSFILDHGAMLQHGGRSEVN